METPSQMRPVEVIYEEAKTFWKTKNTIDLAFACHRPHAIIEVIAYDPAHNFEAPRIYLNEEIIVNKLPEGSIESKLNVAKEQLIRRKIGFNEEKLSLVAKKQAISEYIEARLSLGSYIPESGLFTIEYHVNNRNCHGSSEHSEMLLCSPVDLIPYQVRHVATVSASVVKQRLNSLNAHQIALHKYVSNAASYERVVSEKLSFRDLWRIPLVLIMVKHRRKLDNRDQRIWKAVVAKIQKGVDEPEQYGEAFPKLTSKAQELSSSGCFTDLDLSDDLYKSLSSPRYNAGKNGCGISLQVDTTEMEPQGTKFKHLSDLVRNLVEQRRSAKPKTPKAHTPTRKDKLKRKAAQQTTKLMKMQRVANEELISSHSADYEDSELSLEVKWNQCNTRRSLTEDILVRVTSTFASIRGSFCNNKPQGLRIDVSQPSSVDVAKNRPITPPTQLLDGQSDRASRVRFSVPKVDVIGKDANKVLPADALESSMHMKLCKEKAKCAARLNESKEGLSIADHFYRSIVKYGRSIRVVPMVHK